MGWFQVVDYAIRGILALQSGYSIYRKVQNEEYKTISDITEIALHGVNICAVGGEAVARNNVWQGQKLENFVKIARTSAFAANSIPVIKDSNLPTVSKVAKVGGVFLTNICPVLEMDQAYQTIGSIVLVADSWYFRKKKATQQPHDDDFDGFVDLGEPPTQNDAAAEEIEIPIGFDLWVRGQASCHDKICHASLTYYMFNVMVCKNNSSFHVDKRFLDSWLDKGQTSFVHKGVTYNVDDFQLDAQRTKDNCEYYRDVLVPFVQSTLQRNAQAQF